MTVIKKLDDVTSLVIADKGCLLVFTVTDKEIDGFHRLTVTYQGKNIQRAIKPEGLKEIIKSVIDHFGYPKESYMLYFRHSLGTIEENRKNSSLINDMKEEKRFFAALGMGKCGSMLSKNTLSVKTPMYSTFSPFYAI